MTMALESSVKTKEAGRASDHKKLLSWFRSLLWGICLGLWRPEQHWHFPRALSCPDRGICLCVPHKETTLSSLALIAILVTSSEEAFIFRLRAWLKGLVAWDILLVLPKRAASLHCWGKWLQDGGNHCDVTLNSRTGDGSSWAWKPVCGFVPDSALYSNCIFLCHANVGVLKKIPQLYLSSSAWNCMVHGTSLKQFDVL